MSWDLEEAVAYYKSQGAPGDQLALVNFLKECQQHHGGAVPKGVIPLAAEKFGVKESYFLAVIKRIPGLRLADTHTLALCAGPNCGKHKALAACAEKLCAGKAALEFVPCMRLCGKGPNIRFDGKVYHGADEALLRKLLENL